MDGVSRGAGLLARLRMTVIALGVAGSVMSVSLFALASPAFVNDFHVSFAALQWRTLLFWTAFGVGMPFFGRLSERLSARTQFIAGLVVFCASMVLNALTPNWFVFLFAAVIQGIADAMVVPVQSVMIRRLFPEGERGWAFGWQSGTLAAAALLGPPVGGFLLTVVAWRDIFWLLLGVGLVSLVLAGLVLPRFAVKDEDRATGTLPWASTGWRVTISSSASARLRNRRRWTG
jgi:MFS family permease